MNDILTPTPPMCDIIAWAGAQTNVALPADSLAALCGDAGNRRYYRLSLPSDSSLADSLSYIIAHDSSPQQFQQFLAIHSLLRGAQVAVPALIAHDEKVQLLMLEDFGDVTYWQQLHTQPDSANALYGDAIEMLINIQQANTATLPAYDDALLSGEMQLFDEWYVQRHCKRALTAQQQTTLNRMMNFLCERIQTMPQTFVHRDYHSRNLMWRNDSDSPIGVLDFQDAVRGAAAYDMLSLLRDAYIQWTLAQQKTWLQQYWQRAHARGVNIESDFNQHWQNFNLVGIQRGLKVVGIFCRLAYRDNKPRYLDDIPLAYHHLLDGCRIACSITDDEAFINLIEELKPCAP